MFDRNLQSKLLAALDDTPAVLIIGARQVGKTTLARSVQNGVYLTFDDANVLSSARQSPVDFIANLSKPVVIDEIQLCPEILPAIKRSIDENRTSGQFILTGSANVMTLPRTGESLAGRIQILALRTLSQNELTGNHNNFIDKLFADDFAFPTVFPQQEERDDLLVRMLTGGYPEVVSRKTESRRLDWFQSYITTILQRDVRDLANIEGLTEMPRLLSMLAARAGGLLNVAEVSRSIGLTQMSVHRYLALLEQVFLVELVPAWSGSLKSRLVKAPKIYISDTGLLSYLQGLSFKKLKNELTLTGSLTENFVVCELKKQLGWSETRAEMFHLRTSNEREIDVILENSAGEITAIEIKASMSVNTHNFDALRMLADSLPDKFKRGVVIYTGEKFLSFGEKLFLVPITALWG